MAGPFDLTGFNTPMPRFHNHSIGLVRQFHTTFKHPVAKNVTVGDAKLRRLRVMLIASELAELAQALGVSLELEVKPATGPAEKNDMNGMRSRLSVVDTALCYANEFVDIVETADALADLDYVVQGANLVFGLPSALILHEVHASNMSKLDKNGKPIYDADGKVVKGPNFRLPEIARVLEEFSREDEL